MEAVVVRAVTDRELVLVPEDVVVVLSRLPQSMVKVRRRARHRIYFG
jgi:hypothetical protein